jgi:hypothetical protein
MLMFLLLKTNVKRMEEIRRRFFWQGGRLRKNTTWLDGKKCARQRRKGVWVYKI